MCTGRLGWQTVCFRVPNYKDRLYKVNINLVDILEINAEKQVLDNNRK